MDPIQMGSMRIAISFIAFIPIAIRHKAHIPWRLLPYFVLVGLLGSGIPAYCYALAQTELNSGITGLINSLVPLFAFLIGILFFRSKFEFSKLSGLVLGFLGATLLIYKGEPESATNLWYSLFVIAGTICYGLNVNIVKIYFHNTKPIVVSAISFCMIGPPALLYILYTGAIPTIMEHDQALLSLSALTILSLIGTVLATILYFTLVQNTSAVFGSAVAYLMPIVAIFWGLLDGEPIGIIHILSFVLILISIYIIRK